MQDFHCKDKGIVAFVDTIAVGCFSTIRVLCNCVFQIFHKASSSIGNLTSYYRLVESYRNADDLICHRTILNVGFMEDSNVDRRKDTKAPYR